jgi:hypothetical protein
MHHAPRRRSGAVLTGLLTSGAFAIVLSATQAGCAAPPRDTSATPPPPRMPIVAGDDVAPGPATARGAADSPPAKP